MPDIKEDIKQNTKLADATKLPADKPKKSTKSWLAKADDFLAKWQRISVAEKIFFVQHLGIMIKAGVSLARALETLAEQAKNKRLKTIISQITKSVEEGHTLAESLQPHAGVFSEMFINMISSGEVSGKLEEVLKELHTQMKKDHELISKIRGALIYPAVIFIAMTGIGIGMMIYVVPKMVDIFKDASIELPIATKILIAVSDGLVNHGILIGIVILVIVVILWRFLKSPSGKYIWHTILIYAPIISPIVKKINLARFARTLSSLLQTDIKIVESFEITAKTLGNVHYKQSLTLAAERIKKGEQVNEVLKAYPHLYSHVIIQMINVGEETGELDSILKELADFYEGEVEQIMNTLPSIIEPLIILILASGIGLMAVAIITPMYSLTENF